MNLQNILNDLESVDPEVYERLEHVSRRHVFQNLLKKAVVGATATAPVVLGSILNKAYGQGNVVVEVLNFALTLEYLEAEFYNNGLASGLLTGEALTTFKQIAKHENAHVALLKSALGSAAIAKPNFDFTAGGAFPNPFGNYPMFMTLSQAFEDTGVRAYKGQAPRLMPTPDVLTVALQIHSVEALHAAKVRYLNGNKGWIVLNEAMKGAPAAVYAGEQQTTQGGVDLVALTGYSAARISEAFDEPLTKEAVLAIATPFIKK